MEKKIYIVPQTEEEKINLGGIILISPNDPDETPSTPSQPGGAPGRFRTPVF